MLKNRGLLVSDSEKKPDQAADFKGDRLTTEDGLTVSQKTEADNDEGDASMKLTGIIEPASIDYLYMEDASGVSEDGLDSKDLYDSMPELGEEFRFHVSLFPPEDIFHSD